MNNEQLSFEFLVENESFRSYVLKENTEDIRKWETWYENHPLDRDLITKASKMVFLMCQPPDISGKYSEYEELDRLKETIREDKRKTTLHLIFRASKVAAAIAVIIAIGFFTRQYFFTKDNGNSLLGLTEIKIPKGVRKMIVLNDGTKVWINSESTFRYPEKFKGKERTVYLDGEAYFDVAHNKKMPFSVITSEIKVNVIGTAFNVKSYSDDIAIETTLERGIVNIERLNHEMINGEDQVFLKPNQKFVFLKNKTYVKEEKNPDEDILREKIDPILSLKSGIVQVSETQIFTGWKDNKLTFSNERIEDLTKKMERWYNKKIGVSDPKLKDKRLSGTFVNESLNEALRALMVASDIRYIMRNDSIIIYKEKLN